MGNMASLTPDKTNILMLSLPGSEEVPSCLGGLSIFQGSLGHSRLVGTYGIIFVAIVQWSLTCGTTRVTWSTWATNAKMHFFIRQRINSANWDSVQDLLHWFGNRSSDLTHLKAYGSEPYDQLLTPWGMGRSHCLRPKTPCPVSGVVLNVFY